MAKKIALFISSLIFAQILSLTHASCVGSLFDMSLLNPLRYLLVNNQTATETSSSSQNVGSSRDDKQLLKKRKREETQIAEEQTIDHQCPICLDSFQNDTTVTIINKDFGGCRCTGLQNAYHADCLDDLANRNITKCPICQDQFLSEKTLSISFDAINQNNALKKKKIEQPENNSEETSNTTQQVSDSTLREREISSHNKLVTDLVTVIKMQATQFQCILKQQENNALLLNNISRYIVDQEDLKNTLHLQQTIFTLNKQEDTITNQLHQTKELLSSVNAQIRLLPKIDRFKQQKTTIYNLQKTLLLEKKVVLQELASLNSKNYNQVQKHIKQQANVLSAQQNSLNLWTSIIKQQQHHIHCLYEIKKASTYKF